MKDKQRLLALDVMKRITIAGMILVNTSGTWSHVYAPLQHTWWNRLTPTDLIFPFFLSIYDGRITVHLLDEIFVPLKPTTNDEDCSSVVDTISCWMKRRYILRFDYE